MGHLTLAGIGPGGTEYITPAVISALEEADLICGYTLYLNMIRGMFPEKEYFSTPMRGEIERCRTAVEQAESGRHVVMVCSGDAGIYGMAGPVLEMAEGRDVEVEVVPGITAAVSGAAVLGAPLMNDFCVLSLSDHLTPWETIEKRLRSAAEADLTLVLYNPRSLHRPDHLRKACEILREWKDEDTVCGWVRNIGREGEQSEVLTLGELAEADLDMFCTVFIGTSETRRIGNRMVTPRGYRLAEGKAE